jgi:hypothetical protein
MNNSEGVRKTYLHVTVDFGSPSNELLDHIHVTALAGHEQWCTTILCRQVQSLLLFRMWSHVVCYVATDNNKPSVDIMLWIWEVWGQAVVSSSLSLILFYYFHVWGLLSSPEDGGSMFLWNSDNNLWHTDCNLQSHRYGTSNLMNLLKILENRFEKNFLTYERWNKRRTERIHNSYFHGRVMDELERIWKGMVVA